jgi:hypothetical protein
MEYCAIATDHDERVLVGEQIDGERRPIANTQAFKWNAMFMQRGRSFVGAQLGFPRARFRIVEDQDGHGGRRYAAQSVSRRYDLLE